MSESKRETMISPAELQEWLGCGRSMTYNLLATGTIPSFKVGRLTRIKPSDVNEFIERNRYRPEEQR